MLVNLHMRICNSHPGESTKSRNQVHKPCEYLQQVNGLTCMLKRHSPLAPLDLTFRKTNPQKAVQSRSAGHGTPIRLTLRNIRGALPSIARPYNVREPMYKSEFAADMTKSRTAALITWLITFIPTRVVAIGYPISEREQEC